ncbi:MAG: DUF1444 family protein [Acidobacteriota bacterium]
MKTKSWIDDFKKKGGVPVARPFVGDLWKVYVFDRPDNIVGVHKGDLAKLKITEEELDTLALANLEAAITDFPHEPIEEGSPIHVIHAGDNYEASRLLLHHRWRALAQEVKGELLVSAPSRDFVFFVGSRSDRSVLAHFRRKMQEVLSLESYPLSAQVLRWTPEKWVVYDIENH